MTADRKFGTEENLVAIEGQKFRAYIPQTDMDNRTTFFAVERFTSDPARDVCVCPAGKDLRFDRPYSTERQLRYRARRGRSTRSRHALVMPDQAAPV